MPDLAPVFGQLRFDPDRTASEPTGTLGLYFDAAGQQVCGAAIPFAGLTLYGVLHTAGITRCGVAGAEFRIANLPAGWLAGLTVLPGGLVLGNPLENGCSVGFGQCLGNPLGAITLFTVQTIPVSAVSDHVVRIEQANPSSNDVFQCPWVVLCDAPIFTGVCVEGGSTVLNPSPATPCGGTVGVRSGTWGALKRLYH